jgi:hypothetical protein
MSGKAGVAARLVYQLFVTLNKLKSGGDKWTEHVTQGVSSTLHEVDTMHFAATLKGRTPRQADLDLMLLEERFRERQKRMEANAVRVSRAEEERAEEMRRAQHEEVRGPP